MGFVPATVCALAAFRTAPLAAMIGTIVAAAARGSVAERLGLAAAGLRLPRVHKGCVACRGGRGGNVPAAEEMPASPTDAPERDGRAAREGGAAS
jgi:hypothetical protein